MSPHPCVACLLEQHISKALSGDRADEEIWPSALRRQLPLMSAEFVLGRQEDAHEFYVMLLDAAERHSMRGVSSGPPGCAPARINKPPSHIARCFEGAMCSEVCTSLVSALPSIASVLKTK